MRIRKFLVTAALVLGFAGSVFAQEAKSFRYGPTAGLNFNTIGDMEGSKMRVGFHLGVRGEYNFSEDMYLGASLLYNHKGCKFDGDAKFSAGYIDIPVHYGYRWSTSEKLSIFGEAGPYFAIGIAGKEKFGDDKYDTFGGEDGAKRFDLGASLRVGVELNKKIQIGLGYSHGLINMYESGGKNSNITLGVSYMF